LSRKTRIFPPSLLKPLFSRHKPLSSLRFRPYRAACSAISYRKKGAKMTLSQLKLTAAKKPSHISPVLHRRHKLLRRVDEQIALATAQQNGTAYTATRLRSYTDADTGLRKTAEVAKAVKAWTFIADNGKLCVHIRYGARVLELAKGKSAVELDSHKDVVPALELIKTAVSNGELDAQIEAASTALRKGFVRS